MNSIYNAALNRFFLSKIYIKAIMLLICFLLLLFIHLFYLVFFPVKLFLLENKLLAYQFLKLLTKTINKWLKSPWALQNNFLPLINYLIFRNELHQKYKQRIYPFLII